MKLVAIRHGATKENAQGIMQGQMDTLLSLHGIEQALQASEALAGELFHSAWSSDLRRCIATAEIIIGKHPHLRLNLSPNLREYKFGTYEGQPGTKFDAWNNIPGPLLTKKVPGGESALEVSRRVAQFVNDLLTWHDANSSVLVVTHGGPIRILRALYGNVPWDEAFSYNVDNVSVHRFDITAPLPVELR